MNDYPLLLEVFRRNARVNELLLDSLSTGDLAYSDGQGGMTVGQLLSHMASSRGGWLLENGISPRHATELKGRAAGQNLWTWQTDDLTELRDTTLKNRFLKKSIFPSGTSERKYGFGWSEAHSSAFLECAKYNPKPYEMFSASDRAAVAAVGAHLQSGEPFADPHGVGAFPSSPAHFLPYMVIHDANHRGQIVALLRQNGWSQEQLDQLEKQWDILRE